MIRVLLLSLAAAAASADDNVAWEAELLADGFLRQERSAPDAPVTLAGLVGNFRIVAFSAEFHVDGGIVEHAPSRPVRRWETPIRPAYIGPPRLVTEAQRFMDRLSDITGVTVAPGEPNFTVAFVSEEQAARLEMRSAAREMIEAILPRSLCVFYFWADPDIQYAIVVIRIDLPKRLMQRCIEEELAQAMGLAQDTDARPSIFNDDKEFGRLTRLDEAMLRMLHDPRLSSGMSLDEAAPHLKDVATDALAATP